MSFGLIHLLLAYPAELYKMVCDGNETDLNINIPAVMLPHDAGASLESNLKHGDAGDFCFYGNYLTN